MQMDLVILDEMGYLPFSQASGALLFHLLSKLYERTSVIITTKSDLRGMEQRVRGRQADHRAAGSADTSHHCHIYRNWQRVIPLQGK